PGPRSPAVDAIREHVVFGLESEVDPARPDVLVGLHIRDLLACVHADRPALDDRVDVLFGAPDHEVHPLAAGLEEADAQPRITVEQARRDDVFEAAQYGE